MRYEEAQAYLDELGIDAMKSMAPSLERIRALCDALNNPERSVPAIHITGTNGKTSTARILSAVLGATGLSAATYTSPHLQSVRERMTLAADPISEDGFADVFEHLFPYLQLVESRLDERLTYFEILTAMFWLWTAEAAVDVAVVEVGLGGRWDATNVVDARVAILTNVSLDHTRLLGSERETIAREKAGIIKPGAVCVTSESLPNIAAVIEQEAAGLEAEVALLGRDFHLLENRMAVGGRYVTIKTSSRDYSELLLPLQGRHQGINAACAVEAADRFLPAGSLAQDVVAEGLAASSVPGRVEVLREPGAPTVVLDVAHNPDGMSALVSTLLETFAFDRLRVVLGILEDKDFRGMLTELTRLPCVVYATQPKSARTVPAEVLVEAAHEAGLECVSVGDVATGAKAALEETVRGEIVCITGSHYVVGEARTHLLGSVP